jgi:3-methyladenine DNA glycosylase/8-oxoguanine DNA glycosylase
MSVRLRLPLTGPAGEPVDLTRTLNSHGFADLAPMHLDEAAGTLALTVRVPRGRPRRGVVGPGPGGGQGRGQGRARAASVEILGPGVPGERAQAATLDAVRHVLRMDQDLSGFYADCLADPDLAWAATGAGRMLRSPTVFEDVVKTICTTNCAWSATVRMVNALVGELGEPAAGGEGPLANAFPDAERMAAAPEAFYRETVRAGYRGAYLASLARSVAEGELDLEALGATTRAELSDEDLEAALLALPGVGPYAAAHIMMTVGRHSRLILDSWTRPKYARLLGRKTVADAAIRRRFRRFGPEAGLAFWLFVTSDWVD